MCCNAICSRAIYNKNHRLQLPVGPVFVAVFTSAYALPCVIHALIDVSNPGQVLLR